MLSEREFKDIHWKAQDSDSESVLFYRIVDSREGREQFKERIQGAKFKHLVVNIPDPSLPQNSTVVPEADWPLLQKKILDHLYPCPELRFIALTGTNGKTTTTDLVLQLGELIGKRGISIGTLGLREVGKTLLDFGMTSPSLIDLRKFLNRYGTGKDFCVLEASSHALVQQRLFGLKFDGAGWLSFSQDHLDYHNNMDEYFQAKALLLKEIRPQGSLFVPASQKELLQKLSKISEKVKPAPVIDKALPLFFRTRFNKDNLEVAAALVEEVFKTKIGEVFDRLTSPDGRFYIEAYGSSYIVVDFAHTPDALENICQGIRETFPQHRLKVLFGCGGDRDRTKRPRMAEVVDRLADEIYVTSDNPRTENPEQIIEDVLRGISHRPYKKIVERPAAVEAAFSELDPQEKEVLLLAGKGHEDYILINGVKHPYSDIEQVKSFLSRKSV